MYVHLKVMIPKTVNKTTSCDVMSLHFLLLGGECCAEVSIFSVIKQSGDGEGTVEKEYCAKLQDYWNLHLALQSFNLRSAGAFIGLPLAAVGDVFRPVSNFRTDRRSEAREAAVELS